MFPYSFAELRMIILYAALMTLVSMVKAITIYTMDWSPRQHMICVRRRNMYVAFGFEAIFFALGMLVLL